MRVRGSPYEEALFLLRNQTLLALMEYPHGLVDVCRVDTGTVGWF